MTNKEFENINEQLAKLFNLLKNNNEQEASNKIDKAILLINEVETDLLCKCLVPEAAIPLEQNKCKKCNKKLIIIYNPIA